MAKNKARERNRSTVPPSEILRRSAPPIRAIAERLRKIIRGAVTELSESGHPGWRCIAYRHPRAGYVCGIFPLEGAVRLYFEHGARLADPIGLLEGTGRQTRYMAFATVREVSEKAAMVSILLREAIALKA